MARCTQIIKPLEIFYRSISTCSPVIPQVQLSRRGSMSPPKAAVRAPPLVRTSFSSEGGGKLTELLVP